MYLFRDPVVGKNFRLMAHTVGFCNGADDTGGIACGEGIGRNIPGDHTSGTDYTVFTNGNTGQMTTLAPIQQS